MSGNYNEEIGIASAIQATEVIPDSTGPVLVAYDIDLNSGELILTFDEPISVTNLNTSGIQLLDNVTNTLFRLMYNTMATTDFNILNLQLALNDINQLKRFPNPNITLLALSNGSVGTENGIFNEEVPLTMALTPTVVQLDNIRPELDMFFLNRSNGTLNLFFSEVVDTTTVVLTEFTLQNSFSDPTINYALTGGIVTRHSTNIAALTVELNSPDLNEIYRLEFCRNSSECYASYTSYLVSDTSGNSVVERNSNNGLNASMISPDALNPQLEALEIFNLNDGSVTLRFSETVRISSLQFTGVVLQSTLSSPPSSVTLTSGTTTGSDGTTILVYLTQGDLDAIKVDNSLCTGFFNCFINIPSTLIMDMAGNPVEARIVQTIDFVNDMTGPSLSSFDFNLENGMITLGFDEAVVPSTLRINAITLQNAVSGISSYTLTGGNTITDQRQSALQFELFPLDLNEIKFRRDLATNDSNTYITITDRLVEDTAGISNIPRLNGSTALTVQVFTMDMSPVSLVQFSELDLNLGILILSFSEPVDTDSINFQEITIQSSRTGGESVTLTNGVASNSDILEVTIQLSNDDITNLKITENVATAQSNTFITLSSSSISDTSGNAITPITSSNAEPVSRFIPDSSIARLTTFLLDMNTGRVIFNFDDVVAVSTFVPSLVSIQADQRSNEHSYTLNWIYSCHYFIWVYFRI